MKPSGAVSEPVTIPPDSFAEFEAAARRPLEERLRYAFIKTYKPVMDDASYRSFESPRSTGSGVRPICPTGLAMAAFEYRQASEIRDVFKRQGCRYLFIGNSGAIRWAFPTRPRMPTCS